MMRLEDIKTKNDAVQILVEQMVIVKELLNKTKVVKKIEREINFYNDIRDYVKEKFNLDTTPYDKATKQILNEWCSK